MHIFFSGIGGAGIGPLALIAKQAGYEVSGSDAKASSTTKYLKEHGVEDFYIGQTEEQIARLHGEKPIDWFVYSSALPLDNPNHPELLFCQKNAIKSSKRDELLNKIIKESGQKLIAIAGTHGKTTTTAMSVWLFKQLGVPISYSVGGKISFGDISHFDPSSEYFVYEADEFDRNFLAFNPFIASITGIDWDHPDIYPTREEYNQAFWEFLGKSEWAILWPEDLQILGLTSNDHQIVLKSNDPGIDQIKLLGLVNRQNAWQAVKTVSQVVDKPISVLIKHMNNFPGLSRRFEKIANNLYSDYAHTPPKVRGALGVTKELAGKNVVVVYEGLHNTRQHFIKDELRSLFDDVKHLYIVPSYLAREDKNLELLSPVKLKMLLSDQVQAKTTTAQLDDKLKNEIDKQLAEGNLVVCFSAGGGGSLDEWLRLNYSF